MVTETDIIIGLLTSAVKLAVPLLLAAIGEIFSERSGVINLGMEGMMLGGASAAFIGAYFFNLWVGVLLGMVVGGVVGFIMAYMSVILRRNQIVVGVVLTIFGLGLSSFVFRKAFGAVTAYPTITGFQGIEIPILGQIPIIGPILFQNNILVYLALILVPVAGIFLYKTTQGLKIRAVGENPRAADSLGVNVIRIRFICVVFAGIMAGLAGTYLSIGHMNIFREGMTAGRGYIVLALVIFGTWSPYRVLAGSLLFGGIDALGSRFQIFKVGIPYQFVLMLPYIFTIIVLVLVALRKKLTRGAPAALGTPYER
ncbi:MAG: ABC transporter permease [Methanobacteriota archaeon]